MMKKMLMTLLAVLLILLAAGCSSSEAKELDLSAFCEKVLAEVAFDDELKLLSDSVAADLYDLSFDGLEEYRIYVSATMATANELTVMKLSSADAVEAAKASIERRIADQTANYENYNPSELFRIQNAITLAEGNYLLFAASGDNDAIEALFRDSLK